MEVEEEQLAARTTCHPGRMLIAARGVLSLVPASTRHLRGWRKLAEWVDPRSEYATAVERCGCAPEA
eukprot:13721780-Alexandrium_andersonii.AAC.1